jgi:hypothetical protein
MPRSFGNGEAQVLDTEPLKRDGRQRDFGKIQGLTGYTIPEWLVTSMVWTTHRSL